MKRQPERVEQQQIVELLRHLGAQVYVLGTTRKRGDHQGSMQSPGLPDLVAFVPYEHGEHFLVVEVKAPRGRVSDAQATFADHCAAAGIAHVTGGLTAVVQWALAQGLLAGTITEWRIPAASGDRRAAR